MLGTKLSINCFYHSNNLWMLTLNLNCIWPSLGGLRDKGVVTTYCSLAGTETRLAHVTKINWSLIDFMLSDSFPQGCFDSLGLLGKNRA